jgi:hypothetical protein
LLDSVRAATEEEDRGRDQEEEAALSVARRAIWLASAPMKVEEDNRGAREEGGLPGEEDASSAAKKATWLATAPVDMVSREISGEAVRVRTTGRGRSLQLRSPETAVAEEEVVRDHRRREEGETDLHPARHHLRAGLPRRREALQARRR